MSSPPASALAIHSPGLPSPTGTTPSTTKSSIFSSSDSALSTSPPSPTYNHRKPSKRKNQHVRETQETNFGSKRRRVMGRPKNGWTPTRLRKLTRLYLMTNLEVCEIAEVLHEKGFAPKLVFVSCIHQYLSDLGFSGSGTSTHSSLSSYSRDQTKFDWEPMSQKHDCV